jgi:hypothetical protein
MYLSRNHAIGRAELSSYLLRDTWGSSKLIRLRRFSQYFQIYLTCSHDLVGKTLPAAILDLGLILEARGLLDYSNAGETVSSGRGFFTQCNSEFLD